MATSAVLIFEYLAGFWFFGLIYWILNGILPELQGISLKTNIYTLGNYLWTGALLIYLVFGIWYLIIKIKTWQYFNNYRM